MSAVNGISFLIRAVKTYIRHMAISVAPLSYDFEDKGTIEFLCPFTILPYTHTDRYDQNN